MFVLFPDYSNITNMSQPRNLLSVLIVASVLIGAPAFGQGAASSNDNRIPTEAPKVPCDFFSSGDAKLPSWASGNRRSESSAAISRSGQGAHKALKWHSNDTSGDSIQSWGKTSTNVQSQGSFNIGRPSRSQQNNPFDVGPRYTPREKSLGISTTTQPMMTRQEMSKIAKNNHLLDRLEEYKALKRKKAEEWAESQHIKMPNQK